MSKIISLNTDIKTWTPSLPSIHPLTTLWKSVDHAQEAQRNLSHAARVCTIQSALLIVGTLKAWTFGLYLLLQKQLNASFPAPETLDEINKYSFKDLLRAYAYYLTNQKEWEALSLNMQAAFNTRFERPLSFTNFDFTKALNLEELETYFHSLSGPLTEEETRPLLFSAQSSDCTRFLCKEFTETKVELPEEFYPHFGAQFTKEKLSLPSDRFIPPQPEPPQTVLPQTTPQTTSRKTHSMFFAVVSALVGIGVAYHLLYTRQSSDSKPPSTVPTPTQTLMPTPTASLNHTANVESETPPPPSPTPTPSAPTYDSYLNPTSFVSGLGLVTLFGLFCCAKRTPSKRAPDLPPPQTPVHQIKREGDDNTPGSFPTGGIGEMMTPRTPGPLSQTILFVTPKPQKGATGLKSNWDPERAKAILCDTAVSEKPDAKTAPKKLVNLGQNLHFTRFNREGEATTYSGADKIPKQVGCTFKNDEAAWQAVTKVVTYLAFDFIPIVADEDSKDDTLDFGFWMTDGRPTIEVTKSNIHFTYRVEFIDVDDLKYMELDCITVMMSGVKTE